MERCSRKIRHNNLSDCIYCVTICQSLRFLCSQFCLYIIFISFWCPSIQFLFILKYIQNLNNVNLFTGSQNHNNTVVRSSITEEVTSAMQHITVETKSYSLFISLVTVTIIVLVVIAAYFAVLGMEKRLNLKQNH